MLGTVKPNGLNLDRGFGFIKSESGRDVFFHMSELRGLDFDATLAEQRVSFIESQGERGPIARHITAAE